MIVGVAAATTLVGPNKSSASAEIRTIITGAQT